MRNTGAAGQSSTEVERNFSIEVAERIIVIGPCGAGKSTFARALGAIRDLPVIHLDKLYWNHGWCRSPKEIWLQRLQRAIAEDRWVIDGTYAKSLPVRLRRAELVIHLDYSRLIFMSRLVIRLLLERGRIRSDMATGCPERVDFAFLSYAWRFPKEQRPLIIAALANYSGEVLKLNSPREANQILRLTKCSAELRRDLRQRAPS